MGSKGSDSPIAHQVVDLKTEIERMREQVQNIE
ncbi:MAG: endoribonuclease YicC domain-containing protein [Myxococcota bacterium]